MYFSNNLTATINRKGVLDVDTVKGCSFGMGKYPVGGCYGLCYARRVANRYGYDFHRSVVRKKVNHSRIEKVVKSHRLSWFRIGTMGDPSQDWDHTVYVSEWLSRFRVPVIVTKHWVTISDYHAVRLKDCGAVVNTSISALDSAAEVQHRLHMFYWLKEFGINSILRVVTAGFGETNNGKKLKYVQNGLISKKPIIDNPLRIPANDRLVVSGDVVVERNKFMVGGFGGETVSVNNKSAYLGKCGVCPDQCGVSFKKIWIGGYKMTKCNSVVTSEVDHRGVGQLCMFEDVVEFLYLKTVIGSGFEEQVAKLAIEDKIAYRAARKNMQIHSAIILKINGEFSGFFTFQVNHDACEFCLLQSAMSLDKKDKVIYSQMVNKIIERNTFGYPMIMTVSKKHDLENPKVFEAIGFETYLTLSGFAYMVYGSPDQVRMKRLAHATMTNVWTTTRSDWLKMKKEWNLKIESAGEKHNIPNPRFASRDGCWQGSNGYSNVVLSSKVIEGGKVKHKKGKSFNGNASVLDPVACEVILRFFMPTNGRRIYNPFGGGVQFGFVSGSYGYEYVASEIRQNQCDANNQICQDLNSAIWIKSDSSTYNPGGMFDLCFSCPPYYKVEKYIDYEGVIPEGELNNLPKYEQFKEVLFKGYKQAIRKLKDNCFFVIMTGDSRDKDGAYYGCEAQHELFFKEQGLHIYNKITYLECEFTRLAHAKRTLDYRKFPKREQKILVFFKGDMKTIKESFPPIGRL